MYNSKKVILAAGAFVNFFNLLKRKLALTLKSETTIWARVSAEEALRLSELPALLYKVNEPGIRDIYLVRPVQYPDGEYYIKMGGDLPNDIFFTNLKDIQHWFKNGNNENSLKTMKNSLKEILPKVSFLDYAIKRCIVSYTQHRHPYIGLVDNGLVAAAGGNGYSAMCADAIGKIASTLLLENKFPKGFSAEGFKPVYVD